MRAYIASEQFVAKTELEETKWYLPIERSPTSPYHSPQSKGKQFLSDSNSKDATENTPVVISSEKMNAEVRK